MERSSSASSLSSASAWRALPAAAGFGLVAVRNATPLQAQFLPTGALFALRHGATLLNQLIPGPAEDGLLRLFLRVRDAAGGVAGSTRLVGAGLPFAADAHAAAWTAAPVGGFAATTTFSLHPQQTAWAWRIRITNTGRSPGTCDVLLAQDLGLADEGAVRNNEAYVSQYIDLLPVRDDTLGWTVLARQNQPAAGGRHPWLATACLSGADSYCTDGWQFFGADHRLTGEPAALRTVQLPSVRVQYEAALAGLQSRPLTLPPGGAAEIVFVGRYLEDHPGASGPADLDAVRALLPVSWAAQAVAVTPDAKPSSLFLTAPWLHGRDPVAADLDRLFPRERRHVETDAQGVVQSFFTGADTHVVTRAKESAIARPHGHILRSGDGSWIDDAQFGVTCYAAGIFAAQAYMGNPSFGRLLPVVRSALNVARASGQRIFVRHDRGWQQLGVPSVFALAPGEVHWVYLLPDGTELEAVVWCPPDQPASLLSLRVLAGPPVEFLVSHTLVADAVEFDHAPLVAWQPGPGWIAVRPGAETLVGTHEASLAFAIAASDPADVVRFTGDEPLYATTGFAPGPYAVLQTKPVRACGVILLGSQGGPDALPAAVAAARAEFAAGHRARLVTASLRLRPHADAGVGRVNDVVPWFNHNAAIHFSAPHGLEQCGGAAWGVRDVCQGSIEWLLTLGRHDVVRRTLLAVFAQQYRPGSGEVAGAWPQWFMHDPYRPIQQAHSHGDVCFWPVKALCDYVEASNDLAFLDHAVGYTDPAGFVVGGPAESLWRHCDHVIDHCVARFLPGTALVNYGDGDWDDTLQPADPSLRTRLVSAWTVGLAYHAFGQLAEVCRRAGHGDRAARLQDLLVRMRADFNARLMPDAIVAGFLLTEADGSSRPLLHPSDRVTGIRYRLLPMTRSILAGLFTPEQAQRHLAIVERELRSPDGVRLMSEPAVYHGGLETLFKRANTAANVGREIGLQYVHAHLRYAEALARIGDADRLWTALQVVNPVGLSEVVPNALPRQSNVYFSSSDADFPDRLQAAARWSEVRTGRIGVKGGWRLYSSGPGLYLHKLRTGLLGLRESYGDLVFDPVLPHQLDGLVIEVVLDGHPVEIQYHVRARTSGPTALRINGQLVADTRREANPYRIGGLGVSRAVIADLLAGERNRMEIEL
ncbi:hypothetical protein [Opitutus sp. ER46]|uniref:GH36-type glycosyl hydrolase domain-containing protein n=1 Tax=Opitutus sp. ER46 TaxID=2161864 RepID=UPI000D308960|nr:hypothetical protein [Opitutus sp. ER46]PTX92269.1 hypothetical protein DB354_13035 [Opitutus sp. ER46]